MYLKLTFMEARAICQSNSVYESEENSSRSESSSLLSINPCN